jgi:polyisoprenoid-binding protein YceI
LSLAAAVPAVSILIGGPLAQAAIVHLPIDTQASHVSATVTEPLSRMRDNPQTTASFRIVSGEIDGDPDHLATTGHVKLLINATTYDSGSDMRNNHVLHSVLETAKYPSIIFESTRIEDIQVVAPGAMGSITVVGNLTLHGTTRELRVPVNLSMSPQGELGATGDVTFNYTDFGVNPPKLLLFAAGDEVTVSFQIKAETGAASAASP